MRKKITIDPVTRIEGHLKVECEVDDGKIVDAWSSGTMWRGIEVILQGRDPREAWLFTQRICGVCTTVHAVASVRAVEDALNLEIPMNAQYIRNMIIGAHSVQDHIVHFYHLSALDWVDIVSALKADPKKASDLAESLSSWHRNSKYEMKAAQDKLQKLVDSGQLGVFESGYWGHPAMKLPPEVNLLAACHYLQALEYQMEINKVVAILGGKNPHIQNLAVGGVANSVDPDKQTAINMEKLYYIKTLVDKVGDFVKNVYMVDVAAIGAFYADWTGYGKGVTNYLCVPDMPQDPKGTTFELPGGYIPNGDLSAFTEITSFKDGFFRDNVKEGIKHSWYDGDWDRHPWEEETVPHVTKAKHKDKYSWVKSPTFNGAPAQVGPLANVLCMYVAGHRPTQKYTDKMIDTINSVLSFAGSSARVSINSLHSTIGRHAARSVRTAVLYDTIISQWQGLVDNITKGDYTTYNEPVFARGEQMGVGFHEAPRGVLSHWVVIKDGKIKNYQCVVPSTWNASPRNNNDEIGPYDSSLIGNPMADHKKPLEALRTIHSFDPCIACAIHLVDTEHNELIKVKAC
jgi:hydrogenase large subunit